MFLKIVSHNRNLKDCGDGVSDSKGNWSPSVIPHQDWLFECSQIDVRKHRFDGMDGYHKIINPLYEDYGSPVRVIGGDIPDDDQLELLEIWLTNTDGSYSLIVAVDVKAYAMSENGKTIDKWVCGVGPLK